MAGKQESAGEKETWLSELEAFVRRRPLAVLRFDGEEWETISRRLGETGSFSIAFLRATFQDLEMPSVCLLLTADCHGKEKTYFGLALRKSPIMTLESRLTIESVRPIGPDKEESVLALMTERRFAGSLRERLRNQARLVCLSPMLSVHLIGRLAEVGGNGNEMRRVFAELESTRTYSVNEAFYEDALNSALRTFGLPPRAAAVSVETKGPTVLNRVSVREGDVFPDGSGRAYMPIEEDAVIEHDARQFPEFTLASSDITGRAVFEKGSERLEVITANRRRLEEVLGVDLIYLNAIKQNMVMVQYKMLEPLGDGRDTDWVYRPDEQLERQLARMRSFGSRGAPGLSEYRLNPQAFYLKFVRRDASLGRTPITIPIEHFEKLRNDPACAGPGGAFRISFNTLNGRYLRQRTFFDLIRSGYIGTYTETTGDLEELIEEILRNKRGAVVALHSRRSPTTLLLGEGDLHP